MPFGRFINYLNSSYEDQRLEYYLAQEGGDQESVEKSMDAGPISFILDLSYLTYHYEVRCDLLA